MKDQYVGDIGDFGKYGLLRALCGGPAVEFPSTTGLSLGIVWYLTPRSQGNARDGKFIEYLDGSERRQWEYRACDPHLYDELHRIVYRTVRSVRSVRGGGILPEGTRFFEDHVPGYADRQAWCDAVYGAMSVCDVLFLDPDNGLEPTGKYARARGAKYVLRSDVQRLARPGQTLVVYQHSSRSKGDTVEVQTARRARQLQDLLPARQVLALRYHRGTSRVFFVLPACNHEQHVQERVRRFMSGPWATRKHFSQIDR